MGTTWEDLIDLLHEVHNTQFRSDPERDAARLENLEFVLQRIIEKLRDSENK